MLRSTMLLLSATLLCGLAQAATTPTYSFVYPQERKYGPHKAIVHAPWCGNCTSSALRNALPESDSSVSLTCLTDE